MKKKTPFITTIAIAVVFTVFSVANMIGSHSVAATKEPESNVATTVAAIASDSVDLSSKSNGNNSKKGTTGSKTDDPAYIIIALYNGECYTLNCYSELKKAISDLTILPYPGERCRDVDLMFVGPKPIKKINVVDKKADYIASTKFTSHDKGVTHAPFIMDPELAGASPKVDDEYTYEFYLEIISVDGTISYSSIWYN